MVIEDHTGRGDNRRMDERILNATDPRACDGVSPLNDLKSEGGQATTRIVFELLTRAAHGNSKSKGFWEEPDDHVEAEKVGFDALRLSSKCALVHSEVSELLEAYRKNPKAGCGKRFPAEGELSFKGGQFSNEGEPIGLTLEEEEMADIIIRVLDLAGHRNIDLGRAVLTKMSYNATRPHKHGKTC